MLELMMDMKLVKKRQRNRNRIGQNKSFINLQDESKISPYGSQVFMDQLPIPRNENACMQINSIDSHLNFKKTQQKEEDMLMVTAKQEKLLTEKSENSKSFNLIEERESDLKTKSDYKFPNPSS